MHNHVVYRFLNIGIYYYVQKSPNSTKHIQEGNLCRVLKAFASNENFGFSHCVLARTQYCFGLRISEINALRL